jgi:hypothetical protein
MKLVKFPAMIAGAGMAAQAVGALAAGGVALGSALAPLSGLAAAGAAGYVALGQAAGVVKLATMGLTKALGGNKDAIKALPPAGKDLLALLNGPQAEAQGSSADGGGRVATGTRRGREGRAPGPSPAEGNHLRHRQALGDLAAQAGKLVGSKGVCKDVTTIGQTNIGVIRNAAPPRCCSPTRSSAWSPRRGPLVTWLSKGGVQLAGGSMGRSRPGGSREARRVPPTDPGGRLDARAHSRQSRRGPVQHRQGRRAVGPGSARPVREADGEVPAWTESASGKNQIAAYFQNARGPILQIVGLIGDIGGALLRISQGKGASALVAQLRTLVPVLENVVTSTTAAFGPALIDALGNVLRLFGLLAGSSGPLVQLVRLIGLIAAGLTALLTSVPGLNSMTVTFIGLYGSVKALSVVFGPLLGGLKLLEAALIGQATAAGIATGATLSERIALVAHCGSHVRGRRLRRSP